MGLERDATRDRQGTGTAEQDKKILTIACHSCKQFTFPEKKNFIVLGDSFRYTHLNRFSILVSLLFTVCLTTLNCTLFKVLLSNE